MLVVCFVQRERLLLLLLLLLLWSTSAYPRGPCLSHPVSRQMSLSGHEQLCSEGAEDPSIFVAKKEHQEARDNS